VIENTGGIDGLESQILVIKVTNKQTLGGESIGLDIHVGAGDASEEARLANVGVTADEQGPGVGVDGRKTTKMLADLIQIQQRIFQSLDQRGHATEGGPLELLALIERLCVFQEADIISGNGLYQVLGGGHLTKGNLEMVRIVEGVEQILVERVDVLKPGKALEDGAELVGKGLLGELDLSCVESCSCVS
jgi:hypothetical protein